MIMVLNTQAGVTLDSLYQNIRSEIYKVQIGAYPHDRVEPRPLTWNDIDELVEQVVEEVECENGMRWKALGYTFENAEAICEHLLDRLKLETALTECPRPKKAIAEVCVALALGGKDRIPIIASNTGYPKEDLEAFCESHAGFIAHLKARHKDRVEECKTELYDDAMSEWREYTALNAS